MKYRYIAIIIIGFLFVCGGNVFAANGELQIPVQAAKLTSTFITTPAQVDGGAASWKVNFSSTEKQCVIYEFRVPDDYASAPVLGGKYSLEDSVSGSVNFSAEIMAVTSADAQDVDSASFDGVNKLALGDAVLTTAGYEKEFSITLSNIDSWDDNDTVRMRFCRIPADTYDTAASVAELRNTLRLLYTKE
jgi:hypothetical protein